MPIIDGKTVSPDHAIHQGLCPECAAKLDYKTALPHAQGHWGMDPSSPSLSEEGRRRFNLILDFIEIAKPKPRPEGDRKSLREGVSMAEPTPHEERKWWSQQNRLGNIWSQMALAPISASFIELAEGRYWFAGGFFILGLFLAFVVNNLMGREEITPPVNRFQTSHRYLGIGAVIVTWSLFVYLIYEQIYSRPSVSVSSSPSQPTMMDWNDVISLQDAIATMQPTCLMKLTADSGGPAQNIRNIIRRTVTELKGCEIYDAKQDDNPDFSPNADATPTPKAAPGLIVRWNTDTEAERLAGQSVFNALSRRFLATPGHKMPPNSPPNLIWIQVNGEPWK
jgi:hypothetical protein